MRTHKTIDSFLEAKIFSPELTESLISLKLEGISLSKEAMQDLKYFDQGKLSKKAAIKRAIQRAKS